MMVKVERRGLGKMIAVRKEGKVLGRESNAM